MIILEIKPEFEWLPKSLHELLEMFAFISLIVGGFSVFYLWKADLLAKQTTHFRTINSCMKEYANKAYNLNNLASIADSKEREKLLYEYLILVQEEIYYIKNNFIPDSMAMIWLKGIINVLYLASSTAKKDYDKAVLETNSTEILTVFRDNLSASPNDDLINTILIAIRKNA